MAYGRSEPVLDGVAYGKSEPVLDGAAYGRSEHVLDGAAYGLSSINSILRKAIWCPSHICACECACVMMVMIMMAAYLQLMKEAHLQQQRLPTPDERS